MILAYMKKVLYGKKLWFSLMLCFSLPDPAYCQVEENVLKSEYLQRFTDFTTWPASCNMQDKTDPFVIGFFSKNNFSSLIENRYSQKTIYDKKIKIKYINDLSEAASCHMIYIPRISNQELENILAFTSDKPILTVSDTKGYAAKGVLINLYTYEQRLRFEINESAVKKSGLQISHLLLDFATIVTYQENN